MVCSCSRCICVPTPVVHLDVDAIVQPQGLQVQLPEVAPAHTVAFLPWQLEEECGGGSGNNNPVGDGGPIFPPRDSDSMKFPYQDKKKKKKTEGPSVPHPSNDELSVSRRRDVFGPQSGNSSDGKEREGKRSLAKATTVETRSNTPSGVLKSLNFLLVFLLVSVGVLLFNKYFWLNNFKHWIWIHLWLQ